MQALTASLSAPAAQSAQFVKAKVNTGVQSAVLAMGCVRAVVLPGSRSRARSWARLAPRGVVTVARETSAHRPSLTLPMRSRAQQFVLRSVLSAPTPWYDGEEGASGLSAPGSCLFPGKTQGLPAVRLFIFALERR